MSIEKQPTEMSHALNKPLTQVQRKSDKALRVHFITSFWIRIYHTNYPIEQGIIDYIIQFHGLPLVSLQFLSNSYSIDAYPSPPRPHKVQIRQLQSKQIQNKVIFRSLFFSILLPVPFFACALSPVPSISIHGPQLTPLLFFCHLFSNSAARTLFACVRSTRSYPRDIIIYKQQRAGYPNQGSNQRTCDRWNHHIEYKILPAFRQVFMEY